MISNEAVTLRIRVREIQRPACPLAAASKGCSPNPLQLHPPRVLPLTEECLHASSPSTPSIVISWVLDSSENHPGRPAQGLSHTRKEPSPNQVTTPEPQGSPGAARARADMGRARGRMNLQPTGTDEHDYDRGRADMPLRMP